MFAPYRPIAFTGLTDPSSPVPRPVREQPARELAPPTPAQEIESLSYGMRLPPGPVSSSPHSRGSL